MRFLTPSTKQWELQWLEKAYKEANSESDGSIDIEMVPYLKKLNKIPELVTSYSCSGHPFSRKKRQLNMSGRLGELELGLSKRMMKLFDIHVHKLVNGYIIIRVSKVYSTLDPRKPEVIERARIEFQGLEQGLDFFESSMTTIIKFFEELKGEINVKRITRQYVS